MNMAELKDLLGPEPEWVSCKSCGTQTMRELCFACQKAKDVAEERSEDELACGIPKLFAYAIRGTSALRSAVKSPRDLDVLERSVLDAPRVFLAGAAASGKTSLAVACLREHMPRCLFVRAERLAKAPIEHKAGEGEPPIVRQAKAARVLLLDDLGSDYVTATSAVRDVVFDRFDRAMPTWITSGLSREQVVATYGTGFARRALGEGAFALRLGVSS